jgi:hypothetical protein
LLEVLEKAELGYPAILKSKDETLADFTANLQVNNPKLSYAQLLKFIGARVLLDEVDVREFRKLTDRYGANQWYRLNKSMKELVIKGNIDVFGKLRKQLEEFEQVKLDDYKDQM